MEEYIQRVMNMEKIPLHLRETVRDEMIHGVQVSNMAYMLAEELGESEEFLENIQIAGIFHDIGKLKLTRYLFADDGLMVEQMKYVRQHTAQSYEMMRDAGYGEELAKVVYYHHENIDGTGYPDGLRGDAIPWMSRILRVCDVFIALITDRSYRKAFSKHAAFEVMVDEVSSYDMTIFLAFQRVIHKKKYKEGMENLKEISSDRQRDGLKVFEREIAILAECD